MWTHNNKRIGEKLPRKSMTEGKISPIVKFRVDKEVQEILKGKQHRGTNISEFIRNSIKLNFHGDLDGPLLSKFCQLFREETDYIPIKKREVFANNLTDVEEQRIKEILTGVNS